MHKQANTGQQIHNSMHMCVHVWMCAVYVKDFKLWFYSCDVSQFLASKHAALLSPPLSHTRKHTFYRCLSLLNILSILIKIVK